MSGPNLKVIEFPPSCGDVSAMLRNLAEEIDSGDYGDDPYVVAVISGPCVEVRGFGKVDGLQAIATLNLGLSKMVNGTLAELDE